MVDPRIGHSNLVIHGYSVRGARGYHVHPWLIHPRILCQGSKGVLCPSMVDPRMGHSNLVIRGYSQGCKGVLCIYMVGLWMDVIAR